MSEPIDLRYRPKTYFRPERFEKYLLTRVKGAVLRKRLKAMLDEGRDEEVRILVDEIGWSKTDQRALERMHPMFMGGHYLPDLEFGEVEIARICLRSVTGDVISVYARTEQGVIHYRVVDDSDVIPLEFFHVESEFYPQLDDVFRHRVVLELPAPPAGDECPFCGHFNAAPGEDPCEHAIGWTWEETLHTLYEGERLASALIQLTHLIASAPQGSPDQAALRSALRVEAAQSQQAKALIHAAGLPFEQALDEIATIERGEGWTTGDFLPGSGRTLYMDDPGELEALSEACVALVERVRSLREGSPCGPSHSSRNDALTQGSGGAAK